ncbi:MAG TPA: class I SAM-dependent methyltransferase [Gaiellaceae bacterium]|nr:class I SAM-dependent methyltransferase [Gaiellaceae bacterium]
METDARYERERDFHDAESGRWGRVERYYEVTDTSHRYFEDRLASLAPGRDVLEYGCGEGSSAFALATVGARVTGIDISGVRIQHARERAAAAGLESVEFLEMNAEKLAFPDDSFDVVCGISIIHHLDLDRALAEVGRVLRPGGQALFLEPMGHNPIINLYRRLTPRLRTADEHPLLTSDLVVMQERFAEVDARFFHLTSLAAAPLAHTRLFSPVHGTLERLDGWLFGHVPRARKHAWVTVLRLRAR